MRLSLSSVSKVVIQFKYPLVVVIKMQAMSVSARNKYFINEICFVQANRNNNGINSSGGYKRIQAAIDVQINCEFITLSQ